MRAIRRSVLVAAKSLAALEYHTKHKFNTGVIEQVGIGPPAGQC